jgi:FkbM family methyltransferase
MTQIYNTEYAQKEFIEHGERWILTQLKGKIETIFDVGCNIGEWTRMARELHSEAKIHMFEIIPDTFDQMMCNIVLDNYMFPNSFGLSDQAGKVQMKYKPEYSAVSTQLMNLRLDNSIIRSGLVLTGDDYCESRRIESIDYLKIDVEGAEKNVLKGFERMLSEQRVNVIQFEYGYAAILSKFLLIDAYQWLEPFGFKLGKLTNGKVMFHDYALFHEDFQGPDYVAVHKSRKDLIDLLG